MSQRADALFAIREELITDRELELAATIVARDGELSPEVGDALMHSGEAMFDRILKLAACPLMADPEAEAITGWSLVRTWLNAAIETVAQDEITDAMVERELARRRSESLIESTNWISDGEARR